MRWIPASDVRVGDVIIAGMTNGRVRGVMVDTDVELHVDWDNANAAPSNPLRIDPNDKIQVRT